MIVSVKNILVENLENKLIVNVETKKTIKQSFISKIKSLVDVKSKIPILIPIQSLITKYIETIVESISLLVPHVVISFSVERSPFVPVAPDIPIVVEEEEEEIIVVVEEEEEEVEEVIYQNKFFNYKIPLGWSFFSIPLDLTRVVMQHNFMEGYGPGNVVDFTQIGIDEFIKQHLYFWYWDTYPLYLDSRHRVRTSSNAILPVDDIGFGAFESSTYNHLWGDVVEQGDTYKASMEIIKNTPGQVYKPEWGFNGIGNIQQFEGYQMNLEFPAHLYDEDYVNNVAPNIASLIGSPYTSSVYNTCNGLWLKVKTRQELNYSMNTLEATNQDYNNGWYFIAFKSWRVDISVPEYFESYVAQDKIKIVKDYLGQIYSPEWDFNGIGNMTPGQGYQVKFQNM
jgi:hypothetical protein